MDVNFYSGDKGKIIGLTMASPEEFQVYAPAFVEVPDGCYLATVVRKTKEGRREILLGPAAIGQTLALAGEASKPLPAPAPTRATVIPPNVAEAKDEDLETMAAANGVQVTPAWRKRPRPVRDADVAAAIARKKAAAAPAAVAQVA